MSYRARSLATSARNSAGCVLAKMLIARITARQAANTSPLTTLKTIRSIRESDSAMPLNVATPFLSHHH